MFEFSQVHEIAEALVGLLKVDLNVIKNLGNLNCSFHHLCHYQDVCNLFQKQKTL